MWSLVRSEKGEGAYDRDKEISYGLMFHGLDYPDETGKEELVARFWRPVMKNGAYQFPVLTQVKSFGSPFDL